MKSYTQSYDACEFRVCLVYRMLFVYKQSERNYRQSTLAITNTHSLASAHHTHMLDLCSFVCLSRFNYSAQPSISMMVSDCYFVSKPIDAKTVCWRIYLVFGRRSKTIDFEASLVCGRNKYSKFFFQNFFKLLNRFIESKIAKLLKAI